jgi:hypothetical protein
MSSSLQLSSSHEMENDKMEVEVEVEGVRVDRKACERLVRPPQKATNFEPIRWSQNKASGNHLLFIHRLFFTALSLYINSGFPPLRKSVLLDTLLLDTSLLDFFSIFHEPANNSFSSMWPATFSKEAIPSVFVLWSFFHFTGGFL